jgi:hypothetical protein
MSYFVVCTFDLKNATATDYKNAYADLEKLGLKKVIVYNGNKQYVIPTTTVSGTFTGQDAAAVSRQSQGRLCGTRFFLRDLFSGFGRLGVGAATT